ncbi:MAG: 30S ribosomal protein S6 [Bacteroidetes bacterium]|nr:30S ribosomal protein S6 [Bacteroidota bacterium]MBU1115805.1 30S ribosomal protein S6 [Bacteroidota bacterium]MBU1800198.1 30S ribosomal protein S6 [Bacteroidota bacterium]
MKTNHYESVVILNATLEDQQIDAILTSIEEQMSANGVEMIDIDKWGRKRLAYPIQKGKSGYYVIYHFTSPREYITKFERTLRLDENVIRFLTIKMELKDIEYLEKRKSEIKEEAAEAEVLETKALEAKVLETEVEDTFDEVIDEIETNDDIAE